MKVTPLIAAAILCLVSTAIAKNDSVIYSTNFRDTALGQVPVGWKDLVNYQPARNWTVDGKGVLRVMMKEYVGDATEGDRKIRRDYLASFGMIYNYGVLAYEGLLANGAKADNLADVSLATKIQKTPDPNVSIGLVLRMKDRSNYYAARLKGLNQFDLVKVAANSPTVLATVTTSVRISEKDVWTLTFEATGNLLTARLADASGKEIGRVDAKDDTFKSGLVGLTTTTFGGVESFSISVPGPIKAVYTEQQIASANADAQAKQQEFPYTIVAAAKDTESLNTPFAQLSDSYDVVVAGGGTGGFGAALQAARLGAKVLWLEETDLIGGQMANAGVTSMDEGGFWGKNTARERGIYREFHESAVNHYYTILKDPFTAYHFNRQSEGGFEPIVARGVLYALVAETRNRTVNGKKVTLDLAVRTRVTAVKKDGDKVTGATLTEWTEKGPVEKSVACKVLIDATEYGDVIPLTGARYRVGNTTSDKLDPAAPLQDHTWLGVIREYPEGIPPELQIKTPPPDAEVAESRFKNYNLWGQWSTVKEKAPEKGADKTRVWWYYAAWRGMPDSTSPATGEMTELRHAQCGLNGGNDYPVTAATMEDPEQRKKDELAGINKTLGIIWWFQHVLGLNWSVSDDQGYNTAYNLAQMKARGVREDLLPIAARLPSLPYARESRRIIGMQTIRGEDLYVRTKGDQQGRHWDDTVAINDYPLDLHGTEAAIETDLDEADYVNDTGPFEIPFGAFIPEKVDGFLPAEKNISQSRIVNGASRLQPSTMLNGQAAGAIAALAAQKNVQPRDLNIIDVQSTLVAEGDCIVPVWYSDVHWSTPLWQAVQLLSSYGILNRPGRLPQVGLLGETDAWGANEPVSTADVTATLAQLAKLVKDPAKMPKATPGQTRGAFALAAADALRQSGIYKVTDQPVYTPPYDVTQAKAQLAKKKAKQELEGGKKSKKDRATKKKEPDDV